MAALERRKTDDDDVDKRSTSDINCQPCGDVKATAFCTDCYEYLCTNCSGHHRKLGITKTHILLTGDNMPDQPSKDVKTIQKCPEHRYNQIEYHCEKHNTMCCGDCKSRSHQECEVKYIPDIAGAFKVGHEFSVLKANILLSSHLIVKSAADIDECLKAVKQQKCDALEQFKQKRTNIIECLDKREKELHTEVEQIHDRDTSFLDKLQANLKTCQSNLNDIKSKQKSHENDACELFITAQRTCDEMTQLQFSLNAIIKRISYTHYTLLSDQRMDAILNDAAGIAAVEIIEDLSTSSIKRTIDLQLDQQFRIKHMVVVSVTQLLLCTNDALLKLVDRSTGTVLSEMRLQYVPEHICLTYAFCAAAALNRGYNKKIQFIDVDGHTLKGRKNIDVKYAIQGIAWTANKNIVTSFDGFRAGIEMMSTAGTVIHRIDNNIAGQKLFDSPRNLSTSSDGSVFVFDSRMDVIKLDSCLNLIKRINIRSLYNLLDIVSINNDQLLVIDWNNIALIRPSTSAVSVLLGKKEGIEELGSFAFCKTTKEVFVARQDETDIVMVFKQI